MIPVDKPVYRITCEGCRKDFDWSPREHIGEIPPSYHSRKCKKRKRLHLGNNLPTKCPHPWKQNFRSHQEAQAKCNEMEDGYMKPYRCRCGGIHVGHPKMRIVDWIPS